MSFVSLRTPAVIRLLKQECAFVHRRPERHFRIRIAIRRGYWLRRRGRWYLQLVNPFMDRREA